MIFFLPCMFMKICYINQYSCLHNVAFSCQSGEICEFMHWVCLCPVESGDFYIEPWVF